jgi:SAM-dependent methyltransferase
VDPRRQRIARTHFATLAALFNPGTFRRIEMLGIGPGWHCWEVGAGGATVPRWLAQRSGPGGRVLATDRDVTALEDAILHDAVLHDAGPHDAVPHDAVVHDAVLHDAAGSGAYGFEILRHDLGAEPPLEGGFDLVHARLVLMHVPDRDTALTTMITALRPGGWLLVEDADPLLQPLACPDERSPAAERANKLRLATWELMSRRTDLAFGRTLPRLLRNASLADVGADAYISLAGPAQAQFQRTIIERQRDRLVGAGLATDSEIEQHLADIEAGQVDLASFPLVSAWGRKPA